MAERIDDNEMIYQLKKQLLSAVRRCSRRGLQTGNGGNVSARIPGKEQMLIKASGDSFADSTADSFVLADFAGMPLTGQPKPSRESLLHGAIYQKLPQINAIVHCHSGWATGWASTLKPLPFATYHSAMKLGGVIKVFDTHSYAVPKEHIAKILALFDEEPDSRAFLLKGHGQVAIGTDIKQALYCAELIEETAQIAVIEALLRNG